MTLTVLNVGLSLTKLCTIVDELRVRPANPDIVVVMLTTAVDTGAQKVCSPSAYAERWPEKYQRHAPCYGSSSVADQCAVERSVISNKRRRSNGNDSDE